MSERAALDGSPSQPPAGAGYPSPSRLPLANPQFGSLRTRRATSPSITTNLMPVNPQPQPPSTLLESIMMSANSVGSRSSIDNRPKILVVNAFAPMAKNALEQGSQQRSRALGSVSSLSAAKHAMAPATTNVVNGSRRGSMNIAGMHQPGGGFAGQGPVSTLSQSHQAQQPANPDPLLPQPSAGSIPVSVFSRLDATLKSTKKPQSGIPAMLKIMEKKMTSLIQNGKFVLSMLALELLWSLAAFGVFFVYTIQRQIPYTTNSGVNNYGSGTFIFFLRLPINVIGALAVWLSMDPMTRPFAVPIRKLHLRFHRPRPVIEETASTSKRTVTETPVMNRSVALLGAQSAGAFSGLDGGTHAHGGGAPRVRVELPDSSATSQRRLPKEEVRQRTSLFWAYFLGCFALSLLLSLYYASLMNEWELMNDHCETCHDLCLPEVQVGIAELIRKCYSSQIMNAGNMCDSCLSTRMDPTLPKDGGTVTAMTVVNGLQNAFIVLMCLNVGVLHCVVTHFVQHLSGTGSGGTSSQNRSYSKPLSGLRSQGSALTFETAPTSGRRTPRGKSELRDAPIFDQNDDISMFTSTQSGKSIERPAASDKKSSPHGDNGYPEDSHGSQYGVAGNAQRKLILGSSLASSSGGGSTSAPAPAPAVQTGFSPNALLGGSERVSTLERRRVSVDIGQVQMAVGTGPLGASTLERRRGAGNTLRRMSLVSEAIAREAATEMGANPNGDMGGGNGTGNSSVSVRSRSVSATKPLKEVDGTKGSLG